MAEMKPKLLSDFDGTAVGIVGKTDPRNWLKYPLRGVKGYGEFLEGVRATGVEISGVVSRRPNIYLRRLATHRSIEKLGYSEYFPGSEQVFLTGSETAKGRFVAEKSQEDTIGMIEDKPHKFGAALLSALVQGPDYFAVPHQPILMGVVWHPRSQENIEELYRTINSNRYNDLKVTQTGPETAVGMRVESEDFSLDVVQLYPFSKYEGRRFGEKLTDLASQ